MIRTETGSGSSLERRPELGIILDFIHPDETLVVTRIDRLARSLRDLQVIVARIKEKGSHLATTEQPVDISRATGKAFFDMLGVFAEFETNLCRNARPRELSRPNGGAPIAADLQRSTWKRSGADFPKASHQPGLSANWGFRAEPCTRRMVRLRTMTKQIGFRDSVPGKSRSMIRHKTSDLFPVCSSRCPHTQLRSV